MRNMQRTPRSNTSPDSFAQYAASGQPSSDTHSPGAPSPRFGRGESFEIPSGGRQPSRVDGKIPTTVSSGRRLRDQAGRRRICPVPATRPMAFVTLQTASRLPSRDSSRDGVHPHRRFGGGSARKGIRLRDDLILSSPRANAAWKASTEPLQPRRYIIHRGIHVASANGSYLFHISLSIPDFQRDPGGYWATCGRNTSPDCQLIRETHDSTGAELSPPAQMRRRDQGEAPPFR